MADIFSEEKRSEIMSKIRGKDTKPEVMVRKWLFSLDYRYRKNDRRYPGTPDIVLPKYKVAIFIHGCYWHHHENCRIAHIPKTNSEYWEKKFRRNIERDKVKVKALESMGWRVIVIWECELASDSFDRLMRLLEEIWEEEYE